MFRLLFLFLLLAVGCDKKSPHPSSVLRMNIGEDPKTVDPRKARDLTSVTLMHMLFEGLTRTSQTGEAELALADSVEISDDGLKYVFHLRDSLWSNGDPVTSDDFAASWKTILDPKFSTDISYQLYPIKNARKAKLGEVGIEQIGIQTPDPGTIVVELEQPLPYFFDLLSMSSFLPIPKKTATANPDWALNPETHVSNGPFSLKFWHHSDSIRVAKNPRYWEAKSVRLDGIDLLMLGPDTEIRMFEENKIDWAGSPLGTIPADSIKSFQASGKLHISPFSGTYFFRANTTAQIKGKKNPLSNALFRKALALAIDRGSIVEHLLQGGQTPALSLVPPEMGLGNTGLFPDNSSNLAYSLFVDALTELDLTLQTLDPISISFCNSERNAVIAQAVQQQWEKALGIRVELDAQESKVFFQKLSNKEYLLAAANWIADVNDPINFLEVFKYKDSSTNNTNWENEKYVDLLERSALCRGTDERKEMLREAEQILIDQMPMIPVFHFAMNYLQSESLDGVALSPIGQVDFRWANFEASRKCR